ncbi:MAG: MATE family efflux transporter [Lachnospiraceae bacterium]|nr:MATE family efflux transporter [Lachnospiraceae bacterium]
MKKKLIGDKAFYKMVLTIAVPIMVQNGLSNFVNLLDNLMIGRLGTNEISGVAIANQIVFVYYLLIFGATSGVGIFTAQYHGSRNTEGVRQTFQCKMVINTFLALCSVIFLSLFSGVLISQFLKGEGSPEDVAATLKIGKEYMQIMLFGLAPIGLANAYGGTLRDTGHTKVPMMASTIAIFTNLVVNAILIYGLLGMPALGAKGAAIATVISRFVEFFVLAIYTGTHSDQHPFITGAFTKFELPAALAFRFVLKSMPLMMNEVLWALGQTVMKQCYSYRSLDAVAAVNITSTIWNVLAVAFVAMGDAVGIITGQILGSGDIEKAKDHSRKMRAFSVMLGLVCGILLICVAPVFPKLYNTTENVQQMATKLILVYGVLMGFYAYTHTAYFTLRSGGNTLITVLFDCCFVWVISVPAAYILSRFTSVSVVTMLWIVQSLELIKCVIGAVMVMSGIWAKNIVAKTE